jgi:polyhydroxyalkanoate synthesis regulator phasin
MLLMLEGNMPQSSIYMLYKYNIIDACLKIPLGIDSLSNPKLIKEEINSSMKLVKLGAYLMEETLSFEILIFGLEKEKELTENKKSEIIKDFKRSIYMALLTFTFKKYEKKLTKKELVNGSKLIYKESLKLSNDLLKEITIFSTSVEDIIAFINNPENLNDNNSRLNNAKLVRKIKNPYFLKSIFLALCYENFNFIQTFKFEDERERNAFDQDFIENFILFPTNDSNQQNFLNKYNLIRENYSKIMQKYTDWISYLLKENLLEIDNLKPIFDGLEIQKILNIKAGKNLGILMESLIEYQISQGNLTQDEAIAFLKMKMKEIQV